MRSKSRWILPCMTVLLGLDLLVSVDGGAQPCRTIRRQSSITKSAASGRQL